MFSSILYCQISFSCCVCAMEIELLIVVWNTNLPIPAGWKLSLPFRQGGDVEVPGAAQAAQGLGSAHPHSFPIWSLKTAAVCPKKCVCCAVKCSQCPQGCAGDLQVANAHFGVAPPGLAHLAKANSQLWAPIHACFKLLLPAV